MLFARFENNSEGRFDAYRRPEVGSRISRKTQQAHPDAVAAFVKKGTLKVEALRIEEVDDEAQEPAERYLWTPEGSS